MESFIYRLRGDFQALTRVKIDDYFDSFAKTIMYRYELCKKNINFSMFTHGIVFNYDKIPFVSYQVTRKMNFT